MELPAVESRSLGTHVFGSEWVRWYFFIGRLPKTVASKIEVSTGMPKVIDCYRSLRLKSCQAGRTYVGTSHVRCTASAHRRHVSA